MIEKCGLCKTMDSKKKTCCSSCEVRASDVAGRGTFATRDLGAGVELFREAAFLVSCKANDPRAPRKHDDIIPTSPTAAVSPDALPTNEQICASLSAISIQHKHCPPSVRLAPTDTGGTLSGSEDTYWFARAYAASSSATRAAVLELDTFGGEESHAVFEVVRAECCVLRQFDPGLLSIPAKELESAVQRYWANTFGLEGALHNRGSRFNHSCSPNCTRILLDGSSERSFITLAPVPEGGELTLSYLPSEMEAMGTVVRRRHLWLSRGFLCRCERCLQPQDDLRQVACPDCAASLPPRTRRRGPAWNSSKRARRASGGEEQAPSPPPLPLSLPAPLPFPLPLPAQLLPRFPLPAQLPSPLPARLPSPLPARLPSPLPAQLPSPLPLPAQLPPPLPLPAQVPLPSQLPAQLPPPFPLPAQLPSPLPAQLPLRLPLPAQLPLPLLAQLPSPLPLPAQLPSQLPSQLPVPLPAQLLLPVKLTLPLPAQLPLPLPTQLPPPSPPTPPPPPAPEEEAEFADWWNESGVWVCRRCGWCSDQSDRLHHAEGVLSAEVFSRVMADAVDAPPPMPPPPPPSPPPPPPPLLVCPVQSGKEKSLGMICCPDGPESRSRKAVALAIEAEEGEAEVEEERRRRRRQARKDAVQGLLDASLALVGWRHWASFCCARMRLAQELSLLLQEERVGGEERERQEEEEQEEEREEEEEERGGEKEREGGGGEKDSTLLSSTPSLIPSQSRTIVPPPPPPRSSSPDMSWALRELNRLWRWLGERLPVTNHPPAYYLFEVVCDVLYVYGSEIADEAERAEQVAGRAGCAVEVFRHVLTSVEQWVSVYGDEQQRLRFHTLDKSSIPTS